MVAERGKKASLLRRAFRWAAVGLVLLFLLIAAAALTTQYYFQEPAWRTWSRAIKPELDWQRGKYPSVDWVFSVAANLLADDNRASFRHVVTEAALPLSVSPDVGPQVRTDPLPVYYDRSGVPLSSGAVDQQPAGVTAILPGQATTVVATADQLREAIKRAAPGTYILLLPGTYRFSGGSLEAEAEGRPEAPIFVRASKLGDVKLQFAMQQGFVVYGPYWVFENLVIEGMCEVDEYCEHAFHVVNGARSVVIRNNVVRNFNAPIKVNLGDNRARMPDFGLIEANRFSNDWPRKTSRPVTLLDIVGVNSWSVVSNIIADFAKDGGDYVSYGAFFKGAGFGGVFERNLVMCEWRHRGGTRVGLSLGGGGTVDYACRDGKCSVENDGGVIRNNVIMNCPNDVGLYLNKAANAVIHNNLLANTVGIDVRFPQSEALIFNNIIDGRVLERDGGKAKLEDNATAGWRTALRHRVSTDIFRNAVKGDFSLRDADEVRGKGAPLPRALKDFCGRPHNASEADIGPFSIKHTKPCIQTWARP